MGVMYAGAKMVFGSLVIALALNVVFALGLGFSEMIDKGARGEIYQGVDATGGSFGCNNGHGDLFYCSATEFFTTHTLFMTALTIFASFGTSLLIPFLIVLFLWKRRASETGATKE